MSQTLAIKTLFQKNDIVLFYHPKFGRLKGLVLSTEYQAKTGQTVNLKTEHGLVTINEKFLQRLVLVAT